MAGKYQKTKVPQANGEHLTIYASPKHADALQAIDNLTVFEGIKLMDLLGAVYQQGKKDGRREVFEFVQAGQKQLPFRAPGRPKTRT